MNVHELIRMMSDVFAGSASVKNVYGDPVTVGDRTVIPVAEVRYGFGAGGGNRKDEAGEVGDGGGGVVMRPVGALEITPERTCFIAPRPAQAESRHGGRVRPRHPDSIVTRTNGE